jgi:hypothetical protein
MPSLLSTCSRAMSGEGGGEEERRSRGGVEEE